MKRTAYIKRHGDVQKVELTGRWMVDHWNNLFLEIRYKRFFLNEKEWLEDYYFVDVQECSNG